MIRDNRNGNVKEIPLNRSRFTVGRSDYNDLVLPRKAISREHCVIYRKGAKYLLRDLGSEFGTLLDQQKVAEDTELKHGSRITLGEFEILFREGGEAPSDVSQEAPANADPNAEGYIGAGEEDMALAVQRVVHLTLFEAKELKNVDFEAMDDAEAREICEKVAVRIIRELATQRRISPDVDKRLLLKAVLDEALGPRAPRRPPRR